MTQHRHQRDDPGASGDQQDRAPRIRLPYEVAADRPSQLELVAHAQLTDEVRGHLPVREPLHREREPLVLWRRGDRVTALRLIPVLGRQADVHVLARPVSRPTGDVQDDAADLGRLVDQVDDVGERPAQSPAYRCSRHGSP
jgi:hypothetical protein